MNTNTRTAPEPYTDDELADVQTRRIGNLDGTDQRRLLATVDAERARANQAMWTCPDCAFSFAAEHTDPDGSYTCPCCAEAALTAERDALREAVRRLAKCADRGGPSNWRDFLDDPAEADAIRRALASPTEGNPDAD